MSQKNVEAMKAAAEAFNRRDIQGFSALLAPDAEIVPVRAALEDTAHRGREAAAQWFAAVDETWEDLKVQVGEVREGGDWVLALGRARGRGRGSGADLDVELTSIGRFRNGRITSLHHYTDRGEALEAVGLSE